MSEAFVTARSSVPQRGNLVDRSPVANFQYPNCLGEDRARNSGAAKPAPRNNGIPAVVDCARSSRVASQEYKGWSGAAMEPLPSKSPMPAIVLVLRRHHAAKGRNHGLLDIACARVMTPGLGTSTSKIGLLFKSVAEAIPSHIDGYPCQTIGINLT